jgi:hypothetical protein
MDNLFDAATRPGPAAPAAEPRRAPEPTTGASSTTTKRTRRAPIRSTLTFWSWRPKITMLRASTSWRIRYRSRTRPCFRFLKAQGAIVETSRPPVVPDLSAAALREAGALGAELQQIALDRNRSGATVVTASGFMRAYRAHAAHPITERTDRVPEAWIELASALRHPGPSPPAPHLGTGSLARGSGGRRPPRPWPLGLQLTSET